MIKQITLLLALLLLTVVATAQESQSENKSNATFILTIDGKEYTLEEGERLDVEKLAAKNISVRIADYKKFEEGGIDFYYPSYFGLEYEAEPGYKSWTFNGNDFTILYFEMEIKTAMSLLVEEMLSQFKKEKCTVEPTILKVGGKELTGKRINVAFAGSFLTIDFLEINLGDGKSRFIAFQDIENENGGYSPEAKKVLKMLDDTIKYD